MGIVDDLIDGLDLDQLWDLQDVLSKAASLSPADYQDKFDALQTSVEDQFTNLSNQLTTGRISALQFRNRLQSILRRAMSDSYRFGLGASGQRAILFDADIATIRSYLTEDSKFLSGFYQDIKAGEVPGTVNEKPDAKGVFTVDQRAILYSNALRGIFYSGYVSRVNDPTTVINWELGATEHCDSCLDMEDGNPYTIVTLAGRVPGADVCEGLDRCGCSLSTGN